MYENAKVLDEPLIFIPFNLSWSNFEPKNGYLKIKLEIIPKPVETCVGFGEFEGNLYKFMS